VPGGRLGLVSARRGLQVCHVQRPRAGQRAVRPGLYEPCLQLVRRQPVDFTFACLHLVCLRRASANRNSCLSYCVVLMLGCVFKTVDRTLLEFISRARTGRAPAFGPKCLVPICDAAARRDDGDCNDRFFNAGPDALAECDRNKCSPLRQDYGTVFGQLNAMAAEQCDTLCFRASCDWSKSMCVRQRLDLAQCPLFDAAVAGSVRATTNSSLLFVRGGSARQVPLYPCRMSPYLTLKAAVH
jgi:hypothetical protein